jgi:ankyrin repeat protein
MNLVAKTVWPILSCWTEPLAGSRALRPLTIALLLVFCFPSISRSQTSEKSWRECDTPLLAAIHDRDSVKAVDLIRSGVDLNAKPCGVTALFEAIVYGYTKVVEELLAKGADPNGLDNVDASPLSAAAFYCREEVLPMLITHGANIDSVDRDGYTALMGSTQNCSDGAFAAVLLRFGAKVNLKAKDGATALNTAAFYGNEDAVHVLVAAGADLAATWGDEGTALDIARDRDVGRKSSHDRIYSFLLEVGRLDAERKVESN